MPQKLTVPGPYAAIRAETVEETLGIYKQRRIPI